MSIIAPNQVKVALDAGQSVVGTMVSEIRQPAVMQLLKNAGFDFVIIDNEHGPFNIETIADLSRTAKYLGLTPLVRIPDLAYPFIAQPLDSGAQGLMIPRITQADQVREVVQMMKYPPTGRRGCATSRGFTDFQSGPLPEVMAAANEETLLIIQVETVEAVANIEEIVAVPGVDVTLIGPSDLSIALGVPGQWDSPKLHAAIEKMLAACQDSGVYPAIHFNDLEWATYWINKGMRLVSCFSEAGLMMARGREVTASINQAFG